MVQYGTFTMLPGLFPTLLCAHCLLALYMCMKYRYFFFRFCLGLVFYSLCRSIFAAASFYVARLLSLLLLQHNFYFSNFSFNRIFTMRFIIHFIQWIFSLFFLNKCVFAHFFPPHIRLVFFLLQMPFDIVQKCFLLVYTSSYSSSIIFSRHYEFFFWWPYGRIQFHILKNYTMCAVCINRKTWKKYGRRNEEEVVMLELCTTIITFTVLATFLLKLIIHWVK